MYSLYILKLIGPEGTNKLYSVYILDILKLIDPKGTNRLYSVYNFVQFVDFKTDWSQRDQQVV